MTGPREGLTQRRDALGEAGDARHQIAALGAATDRVVRLEQRSQYLALSTVLPGLLNEAARVLGDSNDLVRRQVARHLSTAQVVNAFALVKQDRATEAQAAATEALGKPSKSTIPSWSARFCVALAKPTCEARPTTWPPTWRSKAPATSVDTM